MDNSLFRDVRCAIALNVAATWSLEKNDKLKFSLATLKEVTRSFLRIWNPANGIAPSSRRILEDVKRVLKSLSTIVEAKGKIVPGLVNRNGHRNPQKRVLTRKIQGKKDTLEDVGIHESIRDILLEQYRSEKQKYLGDSTSKSQKDSNGAIEGESDSI